MGDGVGEMEMCEGNVGTGHGRNKSFGDVDLDAEGDG